MTLGEFNLVAGQGDDDASGPAKITIRPERVDLQPHGTTGQNTIPGMVERVVYVGSVLQVMVNLAPGSRIQAWIQNEGEAPALRVGNGRHGPLPARGLARAARVGHPGPRNAELEDE